MSWFDWEYGCQVALLRTKEFISQIVYPRPQVHEILHPISFIFLKSSLLLHTQGPIKAPQPQRSQGPSPSTITSRRSLHPICFTNIYIQRRFDVNEGRQPGFRAVRAPDKSHRLIMKPQWVRRTLPREDASPKGASWPTHTHRYTKWKSFESPSTIETQNKRHKMLRSEANGLQGCSITSRLF